MTIVRQIHCQPTWLLAILIFLALPKIGAAQVDPPREPWKIAIVPSYALGTDLRTEGSGEVVIRGFGTALEVALSRHLVGTIDARMLTFLDVACLGGDFPCRGRNGWSVLVGGNYMILTPRSAPIGAYVGAAAGVVHQGEISRAAAARLGIELPLMTTIALRLESSYLRYYEAHSDRSMLTWTGGIRFQVR